MSELTVYGWLVLALGAVSLFWAYNERRFRRKVVSTVLSGRPGEGAVPPLTWEERRALARRYEELNWAVALSAAAVIIGFALVGFGRYAEIEAVIQSGNPPVISMPSTEPTGSGADAVLRWEARYPGGRLWGVVVDGGHVLLLASRGGYEQHYLYGPDGGMLWEGERRGSGTVPAAAVGARDGLALLAVETTGKGAQVTVFGPDGELPAEGFEVGRFPAAAEGYREVLIGHERSKESVSADGKWKIDVGGGRTIAFWPSGRVRLYGPGPSDR